MIIRPRAKRPRSCPPIYVSWPAHSPASFTRLRGMRSASCSACRPRSSAIAIAMTARCSDCAASSPAAHEGIGGRSLPARARPDALAPTLAHCRRIIWRANSQRNCGSDVKRQSQTLRRFRRRVRGSLPARRPPMRSLPLGGPGCTSPRRGRTGEPLRLPADLRSRADGARTP